MRWASEQFKYLAFEPNYHGYNMVFKKSSDKPFEQLLALDWHKRLWMYQEIVLADENTCIIKLGNEEMSKHGFAKGLYLAAVARCPPPGVLDVSIFISNVNLILPKFMSSFFDYRANSDDSYIDFMSFTKHYECSDVRDKVFAIQGFVEPDVAQSLKPDYTKSAKEIFTSICLDHIKRIKDIEFLNQYNAAGSPSWVADLERPTSWATSDDHVTAHSLPSAYLVEPSILEVAGIEGSELFNDPVPLAGKPHEETETEY
ncbi:unnamed protein product [Fusarium venenatum]|uniref:Heterokaryon incompatibility domain-containing protein n=1 Tax=Fusarium venenatum TaxID=56646 RepID=A0A2L2TKR1_9HYPO|nr:uncharacterized protein FVRRES_13708 [Fusarium venenatum]CEI41716.1 unnamed protein product [Fusarium venenatum]